MRLKQLLYLPILLLLLQGCEDVKPKSDLTVSKGKVCLDLYKQSTCLSDSLVPLWLHSIKDSIVLSPLKDLPRKDLDQFSQFGRSAELPAGGYKVEREGRRLVLKGETASFISQLPQGIMMLVNGQGQLITSVAQSDDCPKYKLGITGGEITRNGSSMGTAMVMTSNVSFIASDGTAVVEISVENDIASRVVPNDTGTEIVIVDNFKLADRPCCEGDYDDCCPGGQVGDPIEKAKGTGEMGQPALKGDGPIIMDPKFEEGLNESLEVILSKLRRRGYTLLANSSSSGGWAVRETQDIADVCIWADCHKIIVVNCRTGEITCYDTIECPVMIRLNGDGTISILTQVGCDIAKAVQAC